LRLAETESNRISALQVARNIWLQKLHSSFSRQGRGELYIAPGSANDEEDREWTDAIYIYITRALLSVFKRRHCPKNKILFGSRYGKVGREYNHTDNKTNHATIDEHNVSFF